MSKIRVAINGFGRIGRMAVRVLNTRPNIEVVAINDLTDSKTLAHLLKYDSVHGRFPGEITYTADSLTINGQTSRVYKEKDPANLPWKDLGVDIVVESTGFFIDTATASSHIKAGARKVILSAPPKTPDIKTVVVGINEDILDGTETIISNASCTTNCAAPLVKVLDDN